MLWIFPDDGHKQRGDLPPVPDRARPIRRPRALRCSAGPVFGRAFGPFVWTSLIGMSITQTGNAKMFFIGVSIFYAYSWFLNWHYYTPQGRRTV